MDQKQIVFDRLQTYFEKLCEKRDPPWDVLRAFPEPAGMEEFRKKSVEEILPQRIERGEEGERYKL